MNKNVDDCTDSELRTELARREYERQEFQDRVYRGEVEATDADGVVTMTDLQ